MKDDISGVTEQVYLSLIFVNSKLFLDLNQLSRYQVVCGKYVFQCLNVK